MCKLNSATVLITALSLEGSFNSYDPNNLNSPKPPSDPK